jgi:hypothetical protein
MLTFAMTSTDIVKALDKPVVEPTPLMVIKASVWRYRLGL